MTSGEDWQNGVKEEGDNESMLVDVESHEDLPNMKRESEDSLNDQVGPRGVIFGKLSITLPKKCWIILTTQFHSFTTSTFMFTLFTFPVCESHYDQAQDPARPPWLAKTFQGPSSGPTPQERQVESLPKPRWCYRSRDLSDLFWGADTILRLLVPKPRQYIDERTKVIR